MTAIFLLQYKADVLNADDTIDLRMAAHMMAYYFMDAEDAAVIQ
jgi:hypothetical protein